MEKTLQFGSRQTGVCEQQERQTEMLLKQNTDFWSPFHKDFLTGGGGGGLETM